MGNCSRRHFALGLRDCGGRGRGFGWWFHGLPARDRGRLSWWARDDGRPPGRLARGCRRLLDFNRSGFDGREPSGRGWLRSRRRLCRRLHIGRGNRQRTRLPLNSTGPWCIGLWVADGLSCDCGVHRGWLGLRRFSNGRVRRGRLALRRLCDRRPRTRAGIRFQHGRRVCRARGLGGNCFRICWRWWASSWTASGA